MDNIVFELVDGPETQRWWDSPWWDTPAAKIAAVKSRYASDAKALALEKDLRAMLGGPLGASLTVVDPQTGILISAREWWARGITR